MASHHMQTFLRSSIARDPFCHGGLITPDDVLRLEAKFPTLFDKPAPTPTPSTVVAEPERFAGSSGDPNLQEKEDQANPVKNKVTTKRNPPKIIMTSSDKKPTHAANSNKTLTTTTKMKATRTPKVAQGPKKVVSEFHRKCLEEKVSTHGNAMGQSKKAPVGSSTFTARPVVGKIKGSGSSKLTRPAQSFSLEDLRATLKQVMEEDALQQNHWRRSNNSPSPYTEDLVKKFLGWKMRQGHRQQVVNVSKFKGQGDATARIKALTDTITAYHETLPTNQSGRNKLTAHTTAMSPGKVQNERTVTRVRSAPGFLRGVSELPPVPNYQKKRMMQNRAKRYGDGADDKPSRQQFEKDDERKAMERSQGGGGGESGRKHVTWEEDDEEDGMELRELEKFEKDGHRVRKQSSEEIMKMNDRGQVQVPKRKRSGMRGTRIHLRSQKKPVSEQETAETAFANDDRYKVKSSYKELLDARSEKTRYEVKGFLRKQEVPCNFYRKQLDRERKEQKNLRATQGAYFIEPESSSDPSDNFIRKMRNLGDRSKEETNQVLEIMAKELVYMEVLHQINELKRQQEDPELDQIKRELLNKPQPSSTSSSPRQRPNKIVAIELPQFVPTTTDQETSESGNRENKSVEEIILKTPELTPPSTTATRMNNKKKSSPEDEGKVADVISLHTPELSPSPRRLIAAIKERKELEKKLLESSPPQQLDTDCSEMSDFVFSETSRKVVEKSGNKKSPPAPEEESEKLETPLLSVSQRQLTGVENNTPLNSELQHQDEKPVKDGSTLSGVPSTFLQTPSESQKSSRSKIPEEKIAQSEHEKSSAKYSDDFTPENVSEKEKTSVKSLQNVDEDPNHDDPLNSSRDTVIDLLSEGEFLGTSYRSPGELSWRQQKRTSSSNRKQGTSHSVVKQLSFTTSSTVDYTDENDDVEESISILSYGAHIAPESGESVVAAETISQGEYIRD